MLFSELLDKSGIAVKSRSGDAEVTGVTADSRLCEGGACFVALRGTSVDGHEYIPAAVAAGCSAVVCQDARAIARETPYAVVESTRGAVGPLAQAFADWPARKLVNVAVTGTNGKTTVTHLIRGILDSSHHRCGLLGTIGYDTHKQNYQAKTTTPDAVQIARMTAEMVSAGCTHMVMETSSHAIDQERIGGIDFRVGVFTNLSGDHLDYHKTMENYVQAKLRLFEGLSKDATAVINRDDPIAERFAESTQAGILWYGLSPAADLWAKIERIGYDGSRFEIINHDNREPVTTQLIGRHNILNCLAAASTALALGVDLREIARGLSRAETIRGRLEPVETDAAFQVFVDYAHTDDALANVLGSLRPLTDGRIIVVFGCGGDRDKEKRPRMAEVAESLADRIVITSDNPRGEEPRAIIDDIVAGLGEAGRQKTEIEPDRKSAIAAAIGSAGEADIVLIAGKGHECEQILGDKRIHFDDVQVAGEILSARRRA